MKYCKRCLYPENAKPTIIFDEEGVCSGCRYHESRGRIDWEERRGMLTEIMAEHKARAREKGNPYDCIIPVSGGKDSHFQAHVVKHVYGMNPLLVTFNHAYNTRLGIANLNNIVDKVGCDLIRFTANTQSVRKISRWMLKQCGDITWHYHAGIMTFPFQVAVKYDIPLIVWGEHGFAELTGQVSLEDMVEFTKWRRQEHDMRGFEWDDLINDESGITKEDLAPYIYPSDEEIEELDLRGIYMSNFYDWNALDNTKLIIEKYGFHTHPGPRERTFNLHSKIDDHANAVHDYQKYLKFGYGRATDDASMEIRLGRMTREEGIEMVRRQDHVRPSTLDVYLDFLGVTEEEFEEATCGGGQRDMDIWEQAPDGGWRTTDSVVNHAHDEGVDAVRPAMVAPEDRTFGANNEGLFWKQGMAPRGPMADVRDPAKDDGRFVVL